MDPNATSWALAGTAAFLIGLSKAGLKGLSILNVALMALAFGAWPSTGVIMPLLLIGDLYAVAVYHKHADGKVLRAFLPLMLAGIAVGTYLGMAIPTERFKYAMAVIVLIGLLYMVYKDYRKSVLPPWAGATVLNGLLAGVGTMLGNLAGAFTNLYFMGAGLRKNAFVGTAAWLFLITNLVKLPIHAFVWRTIELQTLRWDAYLVPALFLGLWVGVRVVRYIGETWYRRLILWVTALGAGIVLLS